MFLKPTKKWLIGLLPVLLLCFSYYYIDHHLQSHYRPGRILWPSPVSRQCDNQLISEKWESLNFNVSRKSQLFLQLSDFYWKRSLSALPLPYGVRGSEFLLSKALAAMTSYDMPENIKNLPCRTCVVVGNGFSIKNTSIGNIIDRHNIVIRLNNAPVQGYEADVGNRTTIRLFYPESASTSPEVHNEPDTLMVLVPFKSQDVRWIKEILYNERRRQYGFWKPPPQIWEVDASHIRILDPYFLQGTATHLLRLPLSRSSGGTQVVPHPTTGILAIFVALNYCDVVHVAGFGYPARNDTRQPIHYHDSHTMTSMMTSPHSLSHEAKALKRLEESGAIAYLHPHS